MERSMGRLSGLAIAGAIAALLLSAVTLSAYGAEPDPAPDPKATLSAQSSLPLDITGDASLSVERDRLRDLLSPLRDSDGGMIWDPANRVLSVQMTSDAVLEKARELVSKSGTNLQVNFVRVEYTAKELEDLSNHLLGSQRQWAGATGIGGGFDPQSNRVLLQVDPEYKDASTLINAIERLEDPRVALERIKPLENWGPENRVDDFAPWTAGAAIDSTSGGCTLGWAWKLWGTNQVVGSTAGHCTSSYWYNNGTYVGTVFKSSAPADSELLSGSSYSPTVFVGDQTTSVLRRVVGFDASWSVGDAVAMSGRTSGLNVTTVKMPTYTLPSCANEYAGLTGVLMQSHVTGGGDSGGPWLTTQSGTGYVIAHGQHFGYGCALGYTGSFFMKLNTISAAQAASILLW